MILHSSSNWLTKKKKSINQLIACETILLSILSVRLYSFDSVGIEAWKMRGGGGRSFSSRGGPPGDRDYGGKFRGNNSYRDRGSSGGGRFNNQSRGNDRRFEDNFTKPGSSMRNRSHYDRRSSERFGHGHNDRSSRVSSFIFVTSIELSNYFGTQLLTHTHTICRTMRETSHCQENGHAMM